VTKRLVKEYGQPRHGNPTEPLDELFYALFSKKTPPERYQPVFEAFRRKYKPWGRLLAAELDEVAEVIQPLGMARLRARQALGVAAQLKRDFGEVSLRSLEGMPDDRVRSYLLTLPGVGEKIARCVMMYSLDRDVSPMDAHATRLLVRLGLLPPNVSSSLAHRLVDERMPSGFAYAFHVTAIAHGRAVCRARSPRCTECAVADFCVTWSQSGKRGSWH
jgi:endonuclease III